MPLKNALIIAFLLFSTIASATDYYVSSSGNDANNGLSSSTSWKSITKVNSTFSIMKPGDRILFNRGNIFYGTLKISKSGLAGSPIVISAYGTGAKPIITGFTAVSTWTNLGSNIWESTSAVSALTTCNMVVINGVNTPMGRIPNLGSYYTYQTHSANASITCSDLTGTPDWTAAQVVIRKKSWIWQIGSITSQSGGTISYTDEGTFTPQNNWGFFIQNDARTLDSQNEWYYNPSTKKISIYSTSQPTNVKVVSLEYLISSTNISYVTINNISLIGANTTSVYLSGGTYATISNCTINYSGLNGVHLYWPTYTTIDGNIIKNSNYAAVFGETHADNAMISNNNIDSTTMILGVGLKYAPAAIYTADGNYITVSGNKIDHSGYDGILIGTNAHATVSNNFINNSLLNRSDGAGIYTGGTHTALIFDGNIVLNTVGYAEATNGGTPEANGIYLDKGSTNVTVSNNISAYNGTSGIYLNEGTTYNTISGNTCFDNAASQFRIETHTGIADVNNNTVLNNKFIAKSSTELVAEFRSALNNIPSFLATSNNNYYARPMDDNYAIYTNQPSTGAKNRTLVDWQSFTKQDANSHKSPIAVTDINNIRFEFNETKTNKVITLDKPMIDLLGSKYVISITLLPFTSAVLMVDPNPDQLVIPVYTGSVINNATPSLLEINYNVSLTNIVPAASAFSVLVNSVVRTVTIVTISGTKVQLTLSSPIISGDVVTIAYSKPSSNPLQTALGGQAVTISAQPVINNCINVASTVLITSPISNSSFPASANITITANALDADGSVIIVEFYNGSTKLGSKASAPYSFTWNNVPAGIYSLTAVATDNLNAKTISSAISISVINGSTNVNQPPVVEISNPLKGNEYKTNSTITLEAMASDPDGSISKVEFYSGTVKLVELTEAPYLYTWKDVAAGTYSITAIATDNLNASTTSLPIEFKIGANIKYDANSEIVNLYPNPNDGHFSIKFMSPLPNEKNEIIITDSAGKQVYNGSISKEETLKQFDLSYIKSGIYILMIFYKKILVTKKFIIY
jgi:uncharacterized repeat protein (TIGR02059 family)